MDSIEELCCYYISFLRSVALIHQNNHWTVKGKNSFGNHLLFEKIYSSAQEDIDLAAERFVGIFNASCLDLNLQAKMISKMLDKYNSENPLESSLKIEMDFLTFSKHFYEVLEKQDKLTMGLDDMLMSIASNREDAIYHLKQAAEDVESSVHSIEARINLLKKIQKNNIKK